MDRHYEAADRERYNLILGKLKGKIEISSVLVYMKWNEPTSSLLKK